MWAHVSALNVTPYCIDLSSAAHERGGLGRYAASLAAALLDLDVPLAAFVHDTRGSRLPSPLDAMPTLTAGLALRRWRLRAAFSYFGGPAMDRTFPGVRVFHATDHLLPKLARARTVFTLHDTAYLHFPEYYLPRNRIYLRTMIPRFLKRADRVVCVSEHTRQDALHYYDLDPARVAVIGEGVDPRFRPNVDPRSVAAVRRRYQLPERFILHVGTIQPRKNLTTLLDAYARVRLLHPQVGLVIAGAKGWLYDGFFERLKSLGLEGQVTLPGHVPDEELPSLFNAADVFAYPSLFEGFGLPPLEAFACGLPVLCSNTSSLPEVVGDAGLQLPPRDVRAWVEALDRVLDDVQLHTELRSRGLARAITFTWDAAARKTLSVYESLMTDTPSLS
jgi:glycosyltransferase involved in cell wall biosynthesis